MAAVNPPLRGSVFQPSGGPADAPADFPNRAGSAIVRLHCFPLRETCRGAHPDAQNPAADPAAPADDLEALATLGADPDVMRYIGPGTTHDRAVAQEWLERMLEEGRVGVPGPPGVPGWLVAIVKQTGAWAGLGGLKILAGQHAAAIGIEPAVEVGYRFAPNTGGTATPPKPPRCCWPTDSSSWAFR